MKPVIKAKSSALSSSSYRWDAYKTSQTSNHNLSTRIKIDNKSLKGIGGGEEKSLTRKIEILSISKMLLSLDLFLIAAIWFVAKKIAFFSSTLPPLRPL